MDRIGALYQCKNYKVVNPCPVTASSMSRHGVQLEMWVMARPSALGGMFWGSVPWGDVCRVAAALAPGYANCRAFGPDEWRVASGERRVASGEWRVASGEWRGRPIERSCLGANGSALATVFRSCGIGVLEDWFRCPMVDMNCRSTIRRREWKAIGYPVVVSKPSVHGHEAGGGQDSRRAVAK